MVTKSTVKKTDIYNSHGDAQHVLVPHDCVVVEQAVKVASDRLQYNPDVGLRPGYISNRFRESVLAFFVMCHRKTGDDPTRLSRFSSY